MYAVGSELGERDELSLIGAIKTTKVISYLFVFLHGHISCSHDAGRTFGVVQLACFTLGATKDREAKALNEVHLASSLEVEGSQPWKRNKEVHQGSL